MPFDAGAFLESGSARDVAKLIQTLGGASLEAVILAEALREGGSRKTIVRALERRRKEIDAVLPSDVAVDRSSQEAAVDEILNRAASEKAEELDEPVSAQSEEAPSFVDGAIAALGTYGTSGATVEQIVESMGGEEAGVYASQVTLVLQKESRLHRPVVRVLGAGHYWLSEPEA